MRIKKVLIKLRECAGWSAHLLVAYMKDKFSRVEAHFLTKTCESTSCCALKKTPSQNLEKIIDLTSKLGEINDIEHNKGKKYILKIELF